MTERRTLGRGFEVSAIGPAGERYPELLADLIDG